MGETLTRKAQSEPSLRGADYSTCRYGLTEPCVAVRLDTRPYFGQFLDMVREDLVNSEPKN